MLLRRLCSTPGLSARVPLTRSFASLAPAFVDSIEPAPQVSIKSRVPSSTDVFIEHILPFDLELSNSKGAKKILHMSSAYLTHALLDLNDDGHVCPADFQMGLRAIGIRLNDRQLQSVLDRYDDNPRNGVFERNELIPFFDDLKLHVAVGSAAAVARGVESHNFFLAIKNDLWRPNKKMMSHSSAYMTHALLDVTSNGYITEEELQSAFQSLGIKLSDDQLVAIVDRYDDNENGVFEREELEPLFDDLKVHCLLCGYP